MDARIELEFEKCSISLSALSTSNGGGDLAILDIRNCTNNIIKLTEIDLNKLEESIAKAKESIKKNKAKHYVNFLTDEDIIKQAIQRGIVTKINEKVRDNAVEEQSKRIEF